jgi:thiamine pyrophosphokinase
MVEDTQNLVLEHSGRIRASQERSELDIADLKLRVSTLELHQGQVLALLGGLGQRIDRLDERLGRIERRLDPVEG